MAQYILAACTDPGKVRDLNEDCMVNFESDNGRVIVVCDGMGGQNAGDLASRLAVTAIKDILSNNMFPTPEEAISKSIIAANQAVLRRASQDESLTGMGTTCVMLIIKDGLVYYGSVGDSRIYYVANRMIRQITKDQSYVQTLVDAGEISQEQAEHHADKNQVTNAIGIENMTPPVVGSAPISPEPDSIFLLCSDGLSDMINNYGILSILSKNELSLEERAKLLVQKANEAGGKDNITVQLVQFLKPVVSSNGKHAKKHSKIKASILISVCAIFAVAMIGGAIYWYLNRTMPIHDDTSKLPESKIEKKASAKQPAKTEQRTEEVVQKQTTQKNPATESRKSVSKKDAIIGKHVIDQKKKEKDAVKEYIVDEAKTEEQSIIQKFENLSGQK